MDRHSTLIASVSNQSAFGKYIMRCAQNWRYSSLELKSLPEFRVPLAPKFRALATFNCRSICQGLLALGPTKCAHPTRDMIDYNWSFSSHKHLALQNPRAGGRITLVHFDSDESLLQTSSRTSRKILFPVVSHRKETLPQPFQKNVAQFN